MVRFSPWPHWYLMHERVLVTRRRPKSGFVSLFNGSGGVPRPAWSPDGGVIALQSLEISAHGGKSVFFGRFLGPIRAVVPVIAGMHQVLVRPARELLRRIPQTARARAS